MGKNLAAKVIIAISLLIQLLLGKSLYKIESVHGNDVQLSPNKEEP